MTLKQSFMELKGNKVGLAVLILGAFAFLSVVFLVYQKFSNSSFGSDEQVQLSDENRNAFKRPPVKSNAKGNINKNEALTPRKKDLKRQKSIAEKNIIGSWSAPIKNGRALAQLKGGTYQLIIAPNNPNESRWYSNGTYNLKDDILMLKPNLKWGPPASNRFAYRILTRSNMPVQVLVHKGKLLWVEPSPEADIYVPNYHPILSQGKDKIVVWDVLK